MNLKKRKERLQFNKQAKHTPYRDFGWLIPTDVLEGYTDWASERDYATI